MMLTQCPSPEARGTRFSSTVPLYTLFKDKVIISEGGPKGSSVQEDKKEADAALSKLMEEVFYDLDSELRKITAKGMRGQGGIEDDQHNPEKEAAQAPRTGDRTPETRSPISGSCQMEISTPGNNQPSTKYHSDREDDFEDEEFDSYLLARMVEIERQSVVGGGPLGRAVLSDRAEAHAAPTGLPPQHRPAEGPDLSNGLGTGRITAFYIDALEKDGNIYLFCKQGSESLAVSTCILVKNFSRDLFFLPAKYRTDSAEANSPSEAELLDVRAEVEAVLRKHGIYDYSLRVAKKKYCFSHTGVPREAEYLVVSYPYTRECCIT